MSTPLGQAPKAAPAKVTRSRFAFRWPSKSQIASILTGFAGVVVTVNAYLPQAGALGLHIPPNVTHAIQLAGIVVPMLSRSILPQQSGLSGQDADVTKNAGGGSPDGGGSPQ